MISAIDPAAYVQAFSEGTALLTRHWRLVVEMAKRDLATRYSGQFVGWLWNIGHPLFLTGLYIFIFAGVFKTKIATTHELPLDYTVYILAGLIPWMAFQTSMSTACSSIVNHAGLVKQFIFHLEILPTKDVMSSLVIWFVGMGVMTAYALVRFGGLHLTFLLVPILFFFQVLAMLGIAFLLSSITVYFRDMRELVTLFSTAGMYVMPIVYLPEWVPAMFRPLIYLNPFSYMVWTYQDAIYFGAIRHPHAWGVFVVGSLAIFAIGYRVFRRLKPHFSNAL